MLKEMLLPLISASILCSIAIALAPGGRCRDVVRLTAALVLAMAFLRPVIQVGLDGWWISPDQIQQEAEEMAQNGESAGRNLQRKLIEDAISSYIVQQAETMGLTLTAEVTIGEDNTPQRVTLRSDGWIEEDKEKLELWIEEMLGIPPAFQIYLEKGDHT